MAYPEWVLRHKQPGMYVQKKDDDTYRIYRAHSERRPGKKYPVLVTDEYIGTITREHGLIRTPVKLKGDVLVKRYGGFCILWSLCHPLSDTLVRRHGSHPLFLDAAMRVLYGQSSQALYESDWMSVQFPGLRFPVEAHLEGEAIRVAAGMASTLEKRFGDDAPRVLQSTGFLYRVWLNNRWVTSSLAPVAAITKQYGLSWEIN